MTTRICAASEEGRACPRIPVMHEPVALCEPHRLEVALAVVPDLLRGQLVAASAEAAAPAPRIELTDNAEAVNHDEVIAAGSHDPVVYFIANGGRVKIGYTTNLRNRLSALTLRPDNVLLALAGGPDLERALHARFVEHRQGGSEWFDLTPVLFRYIAGRQNGSPQPQPETPAATAATPAPTYDDARIATIRGLYDSGFRPQTDDMIAALEAAGHKPVTGSTVRTWRTTIEAVEPRLKRLPTHIAS